VNSMWTMTRTVVVGLVGVALVAGVAWAGGGVNPGPAKAIVGPTVNAVILMDPHMVTDPPLTPTAKKAMVWVRSGTLTAQTSFDIPASFQLNFGCDLGLTDTRFVYTPTNQAKLTDWVPAFAQQALFLPLNIVVSSGFVPAIVQVTHKECLIDQSGQTDSVPGPGWLYMQATIQFLVPPKK
jgi:hypothetical protein